MVQSALAAAAERVFEFLEEEEEIPDCENPVSVHNPDGSISLEGNVVFENVSFGYDPEKIIIHNFSIICSL